ncbi:MAG: hypothetical protein C5B46_04340 [Proteobacteria bacterium]|nr:MAG: hypothetical protein C5B46_04340 [Pseudomonadota bacterium]
MSTRITHTACPSCAKPIPFRTVLLATCPVWISCPACRAKLVGSRLVKLQGFVVVPVLALAGGILLALSPWSWKIKLAVICVTGFFLGVPNVLVTLKWGRYATRKSGSSIAGRAAR